MAFYIFIFFAGKSSVAVRSRVREIGLGGAPRKLHFSAPIPPMMTGRYYKKIKKKEAEKMSLFARNFFCRMDGRQKWLPDLPLSSSDFFFVLVLFLGKACWNGGNGRVRGRQGYHAICSPLPPPMRHWGTSFVPNPRPEIATARLLCK